MADEGTYIRSIQYKTFVDLKAAGDKTIGFASSFDQRRSWYHPQIKIPVGERIAKWALATQYGQKLTWEPPVITEMKVEEGKILLKTATHLRPYNDGPMLGFAIAGEDGKWQPAKAENPVIGKDGRGRDRRDNRAIVLSSPLVPNPIHYRYAWSRNPLANLKTSTIPLATQRSDNWTLTDMYEAYTGKKPEEGFMNRRERGELKRALQKADLDRRLAEAKALLEEHAPKEAEAKPEQK